MKEVILKKCKDAIASLESLLVDKELLVIGVLKRKLSDTSGQGTTEYAILVGVLVVIAIFSIITFKDKVQELWDQIANGISSL